MAPGEPGGRVVILAVPSQRASRVARPLASAVRSGADNGPVELIVRCACGFEVRGPAEDVIPAVRQHGRDVHNMDVTDEQVLAMARPVGTADGS